MTVFLIKALVLLVLVYTVKFLFLQEKKSHFYSSPAFFTISIGILPLSKQKMSCFLGFSSRYVWNLKITCLIVLSISIQQRLWSFRHIWDCFKSLRPEYISNLRFNKGSNFTRALFWIANVTKLNCVSEGRLRRKKNCIALYSSFVRDIAWNY